MTAIGRAIRSRFKSKIAPACEIAETPRRAARNFARRRQSQFEARASISRDYRETSRPREIDRPRFFASPRGALTLHPLSNVPTQSRVLPEEFQRGRVAVQVFAGIRCSSYIRTYRGSDMSPCLFMFTRRTGHSFGDPHGYVLHVAPNSQQSVPHARKTAR